MRLPIDSYFKLAETELNEEKETCMAKFLEKIKLIQQIAKENMQISQQYNKQQFDKKAKLPAYVLGQKVWLHSPATPVGRSKKLQIHFTGPFYIVDQTSDCNFILRNCETHKQIAYPVHSDRLKAYYEPGDTHVRSATRPRQENTEQNQYKSDEELDQEDVDNDSDVRGSLEQRASDAQAVSEFGGSKMDQQSKKQVRDKEKPTKLVVKDSTETKDKDVEANQEDTRVWYLAKRLHKIKKMNNAYYYLVEWMDEDAPMSWERETDVSEHLKINFHVNRTKEGKMRKKVKTTSEENS